MELRLQLYFLIWSKRSLKFSYEQLTIYLEVRPNTDDFMHDPLQAEEFARFKLIFLLLPSKKKKKLEG